MREEVVRTVSTLSPHSWNRGVMLNYLALLKAELSRTERNRAEKTRLLKEAASDTQQSIEICTQQSQTFIGAHFVRVLAQYSEYHGDVLQGLYEETQDPISAREAIAAYRETISYLTKSATIGPLPGVRWKIAQTHDSLKEFAESSESFRQAAHEYREVAKKVEPLAGVFQDFASYMEAWVLIEEAKVLDARMEEEASAAKYKAASDSFRTLLNETSHQSTRAELETLSRLCEAWAKLKRAETSASPELYAEAAKSFLLAESKSSGKKLKLSAIANASMCKALEYGSIFRRTRDTQLYQEIKKNLETAADFYEEAGIKKAADWTRATQRFFDALRYLRDAETEPDPKKRPELFHLAENHLRLAATIYGEAGYTKKKQEALRHLERAKEEKQLLLMPVEVLEESPAVSEVTISPVSLLEDSRAGLERLQSAHIRGIFTISNTELNAGDRLTSELQIVNIGKEPATLDRLENLVPEGFELVGENNAYSSQDRSINLRGKRLEHLKSHQVAVTLRLRRKGKYVLNPRLTYFDDKGNAEAYEFEPKSISVKEIGVMGWIRGPS